MFYFSVLVVVGNVNAFANTFQNRCLGCQCICGEIPNRLDVWERYLAPAVGCMLYFRVQFGEEGGWVVRHQMRYVFLVFG